MKNSFNKTSLIKELLSSRRIETVYPSKEIFKQILLSGKKLSFYMGIDPTTSSLHLGHSVGLFVARMLQKLGHRIIILIGDFTGQVGDPTGKLSARSVLTHKEAFTNAKTYKQQIGHIIDFGGINPATIQFNSAWLSKLTFGDFLTIAKHFTSNQMIKRDMFQKRLEQGKEIYLNEFLYPIMQGYDSVALNVDGEIGGSDQTFNMLIGRDLMKKIKHKEKFVITTHLLVNPKTGEKLSKTGGGYISLNDSAQEMYGKVMAISDEFVEPCFMLCTQIPEKTINEFKNTMSPRDFKARLAYELTKLYHSEKLAHKAEQEFLTVFQKKKIPMSAPVKIYNFSKDEGEPTLIDVFVKTMIFPSKSEAVRVIKQGGVSKDDSAGGEFVRVLDPKEKIFKETTFRVGKHKFFKVVLKKS